MECGRIIPPDEVQIVDDQVAVALQPLTSLLDVSHAEIMKEMSLAGQICAACYRRHDDEYPLRQWAQTMADHPLEHPAMFRFQRIKKGDKHVGD